ncbi:MAG TPA: hypothetical protein VNK06_00900, partial [Thermodesulfobacteriota bacterium]|nr:hypothetical protein [Thermodesulfobacteriota bacterium]
MKKEFHAFFMGRTKNSPGSATIFTVKKSIKIRKYFVLLWKNLTQYGATAGPRWRVSEGQAFQTFLGRFTSVFLSVVFRRHGSYLPT